MTIFFLLCTFILHLFFENFPGIFTSLRAGGPHALSFSVRQGVFRKSSHLLLRCTPEITTIAARTARGKVSENRKISARAKSDANWARSGAVGNFQFSPLARFSAATVTDFPTVWGCRKNKLELIFCPHGFFTARRTGRSRAGSRVFHEVLCVCMLLIIFPRLRCFFR